MVVKIVGQALIFTSSLPKATIEKAEKFVPESLKLIQGEGDDKREVCMIGTGKTAGISKSGVIFNAANAEGNAQGTIMLPDMKAAERKQYVEDHYGLALVNASAVEGQINAGLAARETTLAALFDNMEVE